MLVHIICHMCALRALPTLCFVMFVSFERRRVCALSTRARAAALRACVRFVRARRADDSNILLLIIWLCVRRNCARLRAAHTCPPKIRAHHLKMRRRKGQQQHANANSSKYTHTQTVALQIENPHFDTLAPRSRKHICRRQSLSERVVVLVAAAISQCAEHDELYVVYVVEYIAEIVLYVCRAVRS